MTAQPRLSLTEWTVLALLAEGPNHGFALSRELTADGDLGRVITVRRPLVYRALDRLVDAGLAATHGREPGRSGPTRVIHRATAAGERAVDAWLETPVEHLRDIRVAFLAKLRLLERRGRSPVPLADAQSAALGETIDELLSRRDGDAVDHWRACSAAAAADFLTRLRAAR